MRCFDINDEIRQANLRMVNLADEADTITGQNIAIGVVPFLFFFPLAFAMNLKDAPQTEIHAYDVRNRTLVNLGRNQDCETLHAYSTQEAINVADGNDAEEDAPSKEGNTDVAMQNSGESTHNAAALAHAAVPPPVARSSSHGGTTHKARTKEPMSIAAAPAPAPKTSSAPSGHTAKPTLKDLMGMFLHGEVSKEEYLELRENMAGR